LVEAIVKAAEEEARYIANGAMRMAEIERSLTQVLDDAGYPALKFEFDRQ
jgi:hypothetical protein